MKKRLLAVLLTTILTVGGLTGCGASVRNGEVNFLDINNEYISLVEVCEDNGCVIAYDKNTNVMYMCVYGYQKMGISPILNADGTPKLYEP